MTLWPKIDFKNRFKDLVKKQQKSAEFFRKRTWFGILVAVDIGGGFWHRAGIGSVLIPHPPLINWLLRLGLKKEDEQRLSIIHEFGHLQTLPLFLLYLIVYASLMVHFGGHSLLQWAAGGISLFAFWEIISELYTVYNSGSLYKLYYANVPSFPRVLFWTAMTIILGAGWMAL